MKISKRSLMRAAGATMLAFALGGCGGGSGGGANVPAGNQLAGAYTGSFSGRTATGNAVAGTFTGTVDRNGSLTGTVTQGAQTFPATGTINDAGVVTITAQPQAGVTSSLNGTATRASNGEVTILGTFETRQASVATPIVTGRITGIRAGTTANPFVGSYSGQTVSGNGNVTAPVQFTVDANGRAFGTVTDDGLGTYGVSGFIRRTGALTLIGVGPAGLVETITATTTLQGSAATSTGTFSFTQNGQPLGEPGTFTATRTPAAG